MEGLIGLVAIALVGCFWLGGTIGVLCLMEVRLRIALPFVHTDHVTGVVGLPSCASVALVRCFRS